MTDLFISFLLQSVDVGTLPLQLQELSVIEDLLFLMMVSCGFFLGKISCSEQVSIVGRRVGFLAAILSKGQMIIFLLFLAKKL